MISVPGVGSGLDVNSLVSQLVAAEGNARTASLTNLRVDAQAQISAYGSIQSALSEFQSSIDNLTDTNSFSARTAQSENSEFFTVTSTNSAAIGSYDIEVQQLASASRLSSVGFASADSTIGTGTLNISVGTASFSVEIDEDNDTVAQIRDAINNSLSNPGISATTVNVDDGVGGTETRLLLSSSEPGTENQLTITVENDGDANDTDTSGLSALVFDPDGTAVTNLSEITSAQDAQIRVDGLLATRSSNSLDDVIEDVTINLVAADPGNTYQLTIDEGAPPIIANIEEFITQYNNLNTTINNLSAFDTESGTGAILLGDFTLRGIESQIRRNLSSEVSGLIGPVRSLVNLGITTNDDGSLSLDSEVLTAALESDPIGVQNFFTSDTGFAVRFDELLDGFLGVGQLLDTRTDTLNSRVQDIDEDLADLNTRLETLEERLRGQFAALDGLIAQLNQTSSFLAQTLTGASAS